MEIRKELVIRIVRCLTELRDVKEFVRIIVRCLNGLRAVKEFIRRISKWRFWVNCNVTD